jgi:hypothetical protein
MNNMDPHFEAPRRAIDSAADGEAAYLIMIKTSVLAQIHYYR